MSWQDDAAAYLRSHEGVVNHAYLDVVGLVTIGVGYMVPTGDAMALLDLRDQITSSPASEEEMRDEWATVHMQEKAHVASYYKQFCKLVLLDDEIESLLLSTIAGFGLNLTNRFQQFNSFPNPACVGLMDMIYSLGPQGLFHGFPRLCAAVDRKDWIACADECHRGHVSDERNAALRALFIQAATNRSI